MASARREAVAPAQMVLHLTGGAAALFQGSSPFGPAGGGAGPSGGSSVVNGIPFWRAT